jgi:hypothetical protein
MAARTEPLPPVFEPEAVAPEIVRAAREAPRELWIGHSSAKAAAGCRLAGRDDARQAAEPPIKPPAAVGADNLFAPPPGDPGPRGPFSKDAHTTVSSFKPAAFNAGRLLLALASLAGVFIAGALMRGRSANRPQTHQGEAHPFLQVPSEREAETRVVPVVVLPATRRL